MVDRWQGGRDDYGGGYYEPPHRPTVNPRAPQQPRQYTSVLPEAPGRRVPPGGPPRRSGGRGGMVPPRRRRGRLIRRIIAAVVVLFLVGGVVTWFWVDSSLHRVNALADYSGRPAQGAGTNWLVVGSDSRQGLTDAQAAQLHTGSAADVSGGRTDTMMIVHLPSNGTKPTIVSLLRDSQVDIPGHGQNKINAAYSFGGPALVAQTVEQATGLRIDHYAEIGLGGFASVVDDVGGVTMCLPQADNDSYAGINLPAGCQNLNGTNALGYVRSRHAFATSDFARTDHQRQFIGALASKLSSPGVFLNPFSFFPVLTDLPQALTVDNNDHLQNLLGLAWAMKGLSGGGVTTTAVPIAGSNGSNLLWDKTKATELFNDLNTDTAVPASLVTTY
jgi:LCP family protein required for cell wall assembly